MTTMSKLRQNQVGFTLIELLVVVAIIGILAAIAMTNFLAYRARGFESQVTSDLRNAASANEAWFASTNPSVYMPAGNFTPGVPPGFSPTAGVTVTAAAPTAANFVLTATHVNCANNPTWTFTSTTGQITRTAPCS